MSYTVLATVVWLLTGAPAVSLSFSPVLIGFVVAILADIFSYGLVLPRKG